MNALLAGQIDAMTDIPFAQIEVAKQHGGLSVLECQGGGWLPLCMAVDMKPFDDNRVRQAMRLIVDRQAMLEQVLSGHGRVANDLYSPFDPPTPPLCRSASRTSRRPSRCSRRPATRT